MGELSSFGSRAAALRSLSYTGVRVEEGEKPGETKGARAWVYLCSSPLQHNPITSFAKVALSESSVVQKCLLTHFPKQMNAHPNEDRSRSVPWDTQKKVPYVQELGWGSIFFQCSIQDMDGIQAICPCAVVF